MFDAPPEVVELEHNAEITRLLLCKIGSESGWLRRNQKDMSEFEVNELNDSDSRIQGCKGCAKGK